MARDVGNIDIRWRAPVTDAELVALTESHGGRAAAGWWDQVRPHSLGWVTARADGRLVGFVNVAWDGGDHAFLIDTKTAREFQRRGIGTAVVKLATQCAKSAGCEWLHVDFADEHRAFYVDACGFVYPAAAGILDLYSLEAGVASAGAEGR
ncbi:GNAT family N-acetyltransferase [Mycobacterium avium]|uniref:GNAT family N-acetyltransferase n=1 Tax=Mycobacterium avium TaxID=1764 RepID=UPI000BAF172A|nr:GNAT family N-acetyltransferase [Mycobacterium avium]PBA68838.1 GNAT family N-acetyltransferase [Mycobacterium avium]